MLRRESKARLRQDQAGSPGQPGLAALLRPAIASERRTLLELRARDEIGDDAFHRVEEELDWAEVNALRRGRETG